MSSKIELIVMLIFSFLCTYILGIYPKYLFNNYAKRIKPRVYKKHPELKQSKFAKLILSGYKKLYSNNSPCYKQFVYCLYIYRLSVFICSIVTIICLMSLFNIFDTSLCIDIIHSKIYVDYLLFILQTPVLVYFIIKFFIGD